MRIREKVCFTGRGESRASGFYPRNVWEDTARQAGYIIHSSVFSDTDILVAAPSNARSTKRKTAEMHGISILGYETFEGRMMNNGIDISSLKPLITTDAAIKNAAVTIADGIDLNTAMAPPKKHNDEIALELEGHPMWGTF